ncbi:uncharacterized protein LOC107432790 isoform X1 [Ziziphus jujuba]|uniref:Uncharacterized protein LOC107432790 isoform X1 n=1 Tax=Ziziphus jujuba TaxID=326968 RepID=A0ABM3ITX8_ZIZJJ|nr:uncharacterized protein LOC107432790 isoform X1 [Ziziphus jujuba]
MPHRASDRPNLSRQSFPPTSLCSLLSSPLLSLSFSSSSPPERSSYSVSRQAIFQILKIDISEISERFKEKRWDSRRMLGSGGMPSSHSATVTALAVAIGLQEGTGGPAFALAVVLACVVMYDASGVRLHAGRQAELLNQIVCELPPEHPVSSVRPLRDSLGHTPLQVVAGAVLGCLVAILMKNSN